MAVPPNTYILKFVSLEGVIHFRVKKNTLLIKPMLMFSERCCQPLSSLRFFLKKSKVKGVDTPRSLRMKKDHYIHVLNKHADNNREQAKFLISKLKREEKKTNSSKEDGDLKIQTVMINGSTPPLHFRLKPRTHLGKLMRAFRKRSGINPFELKFTFKGETIRNEHTPQDLEMEQGDIITVERKTEDIVMIMKQLNIH